jgi:hypothetical protein
MTARSPLAFGRRLAAVGLILAVAPLAAGCQPGSIPPPAFFTPSPCPSGWHRDGDGCLINGTLRPGRQLPLPVISGTPVPQPGASPAGMLDARPGPR